MIHSLSLLCYPFLQIVICVRGHVLEGATLASIKNVLLCILRL